MLESTFKTILKKELKNRFEGCIIIHTSPNEIQGIPDIIVLYKKHYIALEGKRHIHASKRPNQQYYIDKINNDGGIAYFISPENYKEVLDEIQQTLNTRG